ncbi:AAA family ATPase [Intestinimonas butyriciproducens]|uniref:Cytidylate kinase-like family protein n=1 Tax=Candidatus Intestinimonas merdavium TaxID=2838622 RepID=A0A9D1Z4M0_9FIRM|nr:cytidylate kinase-like family protein [Intestinimonas butyriciproducens]MBM6977173.1 cytidylate kinase-like family protein [Intestinimonas butyriciproducens]HIY73914.1 cytidylate kinase-like family protein [Candidatus Intestinimonas merdavium]
MAHTVITIGRQFGSGGRIVAQRVAESLRIPFYDKAVIDLAAKETGLSEEFIRQAEQKKTSSFLYNLYMSTQNLPVSDQVFIAESDVIRKVAAVGPCVIVGRCADYVLRNQEGVLNLFIHAPLDERIFRAKEEYKVEAADVRAYVLKQDKRRAAFYEHFSDRVWGKAENYHLAINSTIGLDTTVDLILALAEERGLHK